MSAVHCQFVHVSCLKPVPVLGVPVFSNILEPLLKAYYKDLRHKMYSIAHTHSSQTCIIRAKIECGMIGLVSKPPVSLVKEK